MNSRYLRQATIVCSIEILGKYAGELKESQPHEANGDLYSSIINVRQKLEEFNQTATWESAYTGETKLGEDYQPSGNFTNDSKKVCDIISQLTNISCREKKNESVTSHAVYDATEAVLFALAKHWPSNREFTPKQQVEEKTTNTPDFIPVCDVCMAKEGNILAHSELLCRECTQALVSNNPDKNPHSLADLTPRRKKYYESKSINFISAPVELRNTDSATQHGYSIGHSTGKIIKKAYYGFVILTGVLSVLGLLLLAIFPPTSYISYILVPLCLTKISLPMAYIIGKSGFFLAILKILGVSLAFLIAPELLGYVGTFCGTLVGRFQRWIQQLQQPIAANTLPQVQREPSLEPQIQDNPKSIELSASIQEKTKQLCFATHAALTFIDALCTSTAVVLNMAYTTLRENKTALPSQVVSDEKILQQLPSNTKPRKPNAPFLDKIESESKKAQEKNKLISTSSSSQQHVIPVISKLSASSSIKIAGAK